MSIKNSICVAFLMLWIGTSAQKFLNLETWDVDSLLHVLPAQPQEEQIYSLSRVAVSLSFIDFEQSQKYAGEAMELARELKDEEAMADAYRAYGNIYFYQGDYPQALINFFEALSIYDKLGHKHTAGWVCYDIARTHYSARNYEKTIEYGHQALEKFREKMKDGSMVGDVTDTIKMYEGLALTYGTGQLGMIDKSIKYYQKAIEVGKKNNFDLMELMIITMRLGAELYFYGKTDSAIYYLNEALEYPEINPGTRAIKNRISTYQGLCFIRTGAIEKGLNHIHEAYTFYNNQGYLFWSLYLSNELGNFYLKTNKLDVAEKYFRQGENKFNEVMARDSWYSHDSLKYIVNFGLDYYFPMPVRQLKEMQWMQAKTMYYNLFLISEKKNLASEALKYHIAFSRAVDTLNILQRNREIIELQTKYETERKEGQIMSLSQENALQELKLRQSKGFLFGLGGLVVIVVLFAWLIIRQNKLRDKQQNLVLQQKLFRSQMNPHFIFNSLTSIQNFILDKEPEKASKYLSRFSKLVRNVLDSSAEEYVSLREEISTIENYLELQKIRFPNKFEYSVKVEEEIDPESISIPPMLAQPFIENAIEHGIKNKETKGNIEIRFSLKDHRILMEVRDDGIGRQKAREILMQKNKEHKSLATAITMERIKAINKKLRKKIAFRIEDLRGENNKPTGTKVVIDIPYNLA